MLVENGNFLTLFSPECARFQPRPRLSTRVSFLINQDMCPFLTLK